MRVLNTRVYQALPQRRHLRRGSKAVQRKRTYAMTYQHTTLRFQSQRESVCDAQRCAMYEAKWLSKGDVRAHGRGNFNNFTPPARIIACNYAGSAHTGEIRVYAARGVNFDDFACHVRKFDSRVPCTEF